MPELIPPTHSTAPAGASPSARLALGLSSSALPDVDSVAAALPAYSDFALLGEGGMGIVFRAHHRRLDRPVAIKMIRPELAEDPSFAERFAREARALARLQHPSIVGIHEVGEVLGTHYLVMEYVDGTDLRSRLQAGLGPAESLTLIAQICEALAYAHAQGVVHRDIKPENILVDAQGRVKIADFGLAKLAAVAEPSLTGSRMLGTPHYMAPEQLGTSGDVDHRADIFALGVVLYEMLTGQLPLGRFDPPSSVRPLDARIDDVVLRSLEHDRERRFQSVTEVRDRVIAIRPAPPAASPPSDQDQDGHIELPGAGLLTLGWIGTYLALRILASLRFEGVPFTEGASFSILTAGTHWVLLVLLALFWALRARAAKRQQGTRRGDALRVRAMVLGVVIILVSCVWIALDPNVPVLSRKPLPFVIDGGIAAALVGWRAWVLAVDTHVPARVVFGPSGWIGRWSAGAPVDRSR